MMDGQGPLQKSLEAGKLRKNEEGTQLRSVLWLPKNEIALRKCPSLNHLVTLDNKKKVLYHTSIKRFWSYSRLSQTAPPQGWPRGGPFLEGGPFGRVDIKCLVLKIMKTFEIRSFVKFIESVSLQIMFLSWNSIEQPARAIYSYVYEWDILSQSEKSMRFLDLPNLG